MMAPLLETAAARAEGRAWHLLSVEDTRAELNSGRRGLAEDEAARRLAVTGPNEVEAERLTPAWVLLLRQFRDPLVFILLVAAAVTALLGDFVDTGVILAVVVLNAVIGFVVDYARTVAMTQMVVFQFFHVFNCRSLDRSILAVPPFSNRFLFVSLLAAGAAHIAVLHVPVLQNVFRTEPLGVAEWALVLAVGSAVVLGGELDKWWSRRTGHVLG